MYMSLISLVICAAILYTVVSIVKRNKTAKLFLYFLISCTVVPFYSVGRVDGTDFNLWFPLGFVMVLIAILYNKNRDRAKIEASLTGFLCSVLLMIILYR